jgi:hypothetical protein
MQQQLVQERQKHAQEVQQLMVQMQQMQAG